MVQITEQEYKRLLKDSETLQALREGGVDNWEGYGYAMSLRCKDESEEEQD